MTRTQRHICLRLVLGATIAVAVVVFGAGCNLLGLFRTAKPVTIRATHYSTAPASSARTLSGPVTSDVSLYLGIKGTQSGVLVGGNSSEQVFTTSFRLTAIARDGETILGFAEGPTDDIGRGEQFVVPDPSVDTSLADGTVLWGQHWLGMFITRFSPDDPTTIIALPHENDTTPNDPTEIDEVVMRIAVEEELMFDASHQVVAETFMITQPHFVVSTPDGPVGFSGRQENLTVNGEQHVLDRMEYVIFVPASVVGTGFNDYVGGLQTVATPILDKTLYQFPTDFTLDPDWINDDVGNAGLFRAIDKIAEVTDPADRRTTPRWVQVAEYFQQFFAKFYQASSTMFTVDNGLGYGGLGNGGNSGFQLIALDDSEGGLMLAEDAVLTVAYEPGNATFEVVDGVLEVTAEPVLEFVADVQYASE